MRIFLLEDDGTRAALFCDVLLPNRHELTHRSSLHTTIKAHQGAGYDFYLLDHDLSSDVDYGNGQMVAEWLAMYVESKNAIIHSWNADGAKRMATVLEQAKWNIQVIPFGMKLLNHLKGI